MSLVALKGSTPHSTSTFVQSQILAGASARGTDPQATANVCSEGRVARRSVGFGRNGLFTVTVWSVGPGPGPAIGVGECFHGKPPDEIPCSPDAGRHITPVKYPMMGATSAVAAR